MITNVPNWQTATPEELVASLSEIVETPTNRAVLFADITAAVGLEATALVVGTLKAAASQNPLMDTIVIAMSTVGLSLSTAERQSVIDSLAVAGQWPDAVRDAVKALGIVRQPRWRELGYESAPTEAEIESERDAALAVAPTMDRKAVLMSLNLGSKAAFVFRVYEAADVNGQTIKGDLLTSVTAADAVNENLSERQRKLVDAILAAVDEFTESL